MTVLSAAIFSVGFLLMFLGAYLHQFSPFLATALFLSGSIVSWVYYQQMRALRLTKFTDDDWPNNWTIHVWPAFFVAFAVSYFVASGEARSLVRLVAISGPLGLACGASIQTLLKQPLLYWRKPGVYSWAAACPMVGAVMFLGILVRLPQNIRSQIACDFTRADLVFSIRSYESATGKSVKQLDASLFEALKRADFLAEAPTHPFEGADSWNRFTVDRDKGIAVHCSAHPDR